MKKLLHIVAITLLAVLSVSAVSAAINEDTAESLATGTGEMSITTLWADSEVVEGPVIVDSIPVSEENEYIFYHGDGCPACAQVKQYFKGTDAEAKFNIEAREVWKVRENAVLMTKDIEALGLNPAEIGVPFFVVKNGNQVSYINGSNNVINHFSPLLGDYTAPERNSLVIIIIGLLLIVLPIVIMSFGGSKNK